MNLLTPTTTKPTNNDVPERSRGLRRIGIPVNPWRFVSLFAVVTVCPIARDVSRTTLVATKLITQQEQ